jgi:DNA-directed RNA polymerase subunit alpha
MKRLARVILLAQPIEDLRLSVRTLSCLKTANILTIGQLVEKNVGELKKIERFGKKSLDELRTKLKRLGLSLNEEH